VTILAIRPTAPDGDRISVGAPARPPLPRRDGEPPSWRPAKKRTRAGRPPRRPASSPGPACHSKKTNPTPVDPARKTVRVLGGPSRREKNEPDGAGGDWHVTRPPPHPSASASRLRENEPEAHRACDETNRRRDGPPPKRSTSQHRRDHTPAKRTRRPGMPPAKTLTSPQHGAIPGPPPLPATKRTRRPPTRADGSGQRREQPPSAAVAGEARGWAAEGGASRLRSKSGHEADPGWSAKSG
jgi:hypothetical protein